MERELEGLGALVTGGASGIGAAVVEILLRSGAHVAVLDREMTVAVEGTLSVEVDVTDDEGVRTAVASVVDELGRLDVVVNCAGIGAQGTVADNDESEWWHVLDVNVLGMVRVIRAALPHLRRSPSAAVVNIGSIAAGVGLPDRVLYSASKGAVAAATRAMAADHLHEGIRINCVHPGTADTPWIDRLLAVADDPIAERAALEARQPHGRLVSPQEVARTVLYLLSPSSGSTTGTSINVDGGLQDLRLRPASTTAT